MNRQNVIAGLLAGFTKLLLALLGIVIGLVLAEMSLRAFLPQDLILPMPAQADRELIYRLPPKTSAYLRGTSVRWFHLNTNSLGLRDREFPSTKQPGTFRILLLGDSMSMAEGVELEETYIKRFESLANHGDPHRTVETINGAIRGYGTDQEVVLFERIGPLLSPDLVILAFYEGNDFDDNRMGGIFSVEQGKLFRSIPEERNSPKLRYYRKQIAIQGLPGYRFLAKNSHLMNLLRRQVGEFLSRRHTREVTTGGPPDSIGEHDWILTTKILSRWRELCEQNGALPMLISLPARDWIRSPSGAASSDRISARLGRFALANRIHFLGIGERLAQAPDLGRLYLEDGHFSPDGHQEIARLILDYLEQTKLTR